MMELLVYLQSYHACEILLVVAAVLICIDYFFPTDWPAHFGYAAVALAVFFAVWTSGPAASMGSLPSLLVAVGVWVGLALMHRFVFRRFLENAPGTDGLPSDHDQAPAEHAPGPSPGDEVDPAV